MTPKVGVFSAVIAVSVGALAFKGVDIAQAFANEVEPSAAVAAPEETALTSGEEGPAPEEAPPTTAAPPSPEQCLTTLNAAAEEMGLSSQEIVVLRSLQARREALDERESGIGTREAAAAAAEARLQEQIAELKTVEGSVQTLLAKMDAKGDERMASLVKSYESMKPKDAADHLQRHGRRSAGRHRQVDEARHARRCAVHHAAQARRNAHAPAGQSRQAADELCRPHPAHRPPRRHEPVPPSLGLGVAPLRPRSGGDQLCRAGLRRSRAAAVVFRNPPNMRASPPNGPMAMKSRPRSRASISNQVLILAFDEKVKINLDKLKDSLPTWAAVTFMDPDGMTARIGLKKAPRLAVTTSVDLVAIDLIPEDITANPPKLVSPLVAKKTAEAEAKRVAAIPAPAPVIPLEVRGSQSGDSSRVAFYWDQPASYRVVSATDGELKLQFSKRAKPDLAYLRIDPPANLADFKGENNDKGYLVTITAKDHLPIKHFMEGETPVVDISKPLPPEAAADKAKVTPAPAPAKKPADSGPIMLRPAPSRRPSAQSCPTPASPDNVVGGAERVTSLVPSWADPAPRNGVVLVKAAPLPNGLELSFPFAAPAPAAVFARGNVVWVVFAANADLKIDATSLPAGYRARTFRVKNATLMRLETPKGLSVSADLGRFDVEDPHRAHRHKPERFVKADRRPGDDGRARVEAMLIGAAGIIWFEDPVIGDQLAVAVSYGPTTASATPRDFVEASLPATAHGLAIAPKSDDVQVTLEGERVVISMASSSQTSPDAPLGNIAFAQNAVNPAFIDFAAWGAARGAQYIKQLDALDTAVSELEPSTPAGGEAAMNLARFYIGHMQAHEAIGLLRAAAADRPELETDPAYLGMRGAASYLAGRLKEAEDSLSRGSLRNDPSASLWRAMVAAQKGEWERAIELFRASDRQLYLYSSARGADFAVVWAEAALQANDFDAARRMATFAVTNGEIETKQRGQLALANLKAAIESPAAAWPEFKRLSETAVEPVAVRAELRRLELGVPAGKMSAADAAAELEGLRFRWRGDEVEMSTVGILADQYMRVGRFRDALLLAQSTAMRDANAPGSRDLRLKLADYFRRLFLNGEADRLDPIQAVALFYEFDDTLMPIGPDGDQMVRKLAQRLVAFDLLEPASALLQYQVDNRLRGVGKAAVAVDLASIYLWDKRPDKALAALNTTRLPNLPKPLALERRLLEAAAYRDLGRYDHVIELVEPLEGPEPKSLLADAYWRDNKWPEAARALMSILPPAGQAGAKDANLIFKTAIAARMSKDPGLIAQLRPYAKAMAGNANQASFDLITAQSDVSGASLTEAVRRLADAPRVDAFATAMKARFEAPRGRHAPRRRHCRCNTAPQQSRADLRRRLLASLTPPARRPSPNSTPTGNCTRRASPSHPRTRRRNRDPAPPSPPSSAKTARPYRCRPASPPPCASPPSHPASPASHSPHPPPRAASHPTDPPAAMRHASAPRSGRPAASAQSPPAHCRAAASAALSVRASAPRTHPAHARDQ